MVGRSTKGRILVAVASFVTMSTVAMGLVVSPVSAEDSAAATETGDALEVAGSLVEDAAPLAETGDSFIAVTAGNEVELPADPTEPLVLGGPGGEISMNLPEAPGAEAGVMDESGAVVYESDTSPVSFAAQATEDGGMQVLVVIDGADAPSEYRYDMTVPEGAALHASVDGGAEVIGPDGVISVIAPPWAVDANGQRVPTEFRIDGTTLVQTVDHRNATYPVIADPKYFWVGWGLLAVEFNRGETKAWEDGGNFGSVACQSFDFIPLVGIPIGFTCSAQLAWTTFVAKKAYERGQCLVVEVGFNPRAAAGSGISWTPSARACGSTSTNVAVMKLVQRVKDKVVATAKALVEAHRSYGVCLSYICSLFP